MRFLALQRVRWCYLLMPHRTRYLLGYCLYRVRQMCLCAVKFREYPLMLLCLCTYARVVASVFTPKAVTVVLALLDSLMLLRGRSRENVDQRDAAE